MKYFVSYYSSSKKGSGFGNRVVNTDSDKMTVEIIEGISKTIEEDLEKKNKLKFVVSILNIMKVEEE